MDGKIRVLLVDDHDIARAGLRRLLELEPDIDVVDEASDGQEALAKIHSQAPDIVLMDLKMAILTGLHAIRLLKQQGLSRKVIVLSFYEEFLAEAIEAGVGGYLLKGVQRDELCDAIRRVHQGEVVLGTSILTSPEEAQDVLERLQKIVREKPALASEGVAVEVTVQPPSDPAQLLGLLARLQGEQDTEITEVTGTVDAGTRLRVAVASPERFEDALSGWPEVRYTWEDWAEDDAGQQTGFRLRVVLT